MPASARNTRCSRAVQRPPWDPEGRFYTTDFGLPADTEIRPLDWWPPQARGLGTGNSMLRRSTCLAGPAPFDEVFGRSGGEDSMLLLGLAKRGAASSGARTPR